MTIDEYLATAPPFEPPIFEAVMAALEPVGPVHVEPLSVGVFLKRAQTFAQLRPLTRWETLSFSLHRREQHPAITRRHLPHGDRWFHVVRLTRPEDLDDRVVGWLAEAYDDAPA